MTSLPRQYEVLVNTIELYFLFVYLIIIHDNPHLWLSKWKQALLNLDIMHSVLLLTYKVWLYISTVSVLDFKAADFQGF